MSFKPPQIEMNCNVTQETQHFKVPFQFRSVSGRIQLLLRTMNRLAGFTSESNFKTYITLSPHKNVWMSDQNIKLFLFFKIEQ